MTNAMRLPWTAETVPHAVLDILRGCNIRCRDCYNLQPPKAKPFTEIESELDRLMALRRLQSVSIVGGEITMHPQLVNIVKSVRQRGLFVELFTNGVGLNGDLLGRLRDAGANVIFLHIEQGQRRPDLPANATGRDLKRLRREKAALVAAHGMEAGLSVTIYPDKMDELDDAISFAVESEDICYLLATWWRDVHSMTRITGDIPSGMASVSNKVRFSPQAEISAEELCERLKKQFGIIPFATLGANVDPSNPRWMSFLTATVHRNGRLDARDNVYPTRIEPMFLDASRKLSGCYPFYQRQGGFRTGLHLLLNGIASGKTAKRLKFLSRSMLHGSRLTAKRFLFQWPAAMDPNGRIIHCECCPDAVLKDNRLVPLCISDLVSNYASDQPKPARPI